MAAGAAPAPTTHDAPALGWDTVFAVSNEEVTAAIKKRGSSPPNLVQKPAGPLQFGLTADFGSWEIAPGGDGGMVNFALPMTNLVASYVINGQAGTVTCDDVMAVIAIRLNVAPHLGTALGVDGKPLPPPPAGTTRHALTPRTTSANPLDPVASLISVVYRQPLSDPQADDPVETAILNWCTENLAQFEHIFAFVDLNDVIATGQWAFCKPHTTSYAYVDKPGTNSGFLAVLCMTSKDPVPSVQQVNGFAIPDGCGAGFLVSSRRFLADMVTPALLKLWPNLTPADLEIATNDKILRLTDNTTVVLPDVVDDQANAYTPVMSSFELQILGNEIQIDMHTDVEVSPGIHATCTSTTWYTITLGINAKGEQTLLYKQSRTPSNVHGTYHDSGIAILSETLQILAIVLVLLSAVVDDGASIVLAAAMIIALSGHLALTSIEDANKTDAPGLDALTTNFTGPIVWTDKDFNLSSGGLHTSLQLGGTWT